MEMGGQAVDCEQGGCGTCFPHPSSCCAEEVHAGAGSRVSPGS